MRRLKILFFWIFGHRNNVSFSELIRFLVKPTIKTTAHRFIDRIEDTGVLEVSFNNGVPKLFWPKSFSVNRLYQVLSETFDENDWHYYQKEHTKVENGEIILDIGTAEGLFPLTVIDRCEQVYLVEPGRQFVDCLKMTFASHSEKISLFNVAVGNTDGEIPFTEDSLDGKVSDSSSEDAYQIPIFKIDTLLKDKKITYLKADIEGFEYEMLLGASQTIRQNKPKIAITTYHTENDPKAIIELVKSYVPEYQYFVKGIYEETPKPVMIHFWI